MSSFTSELTIRPAETGWVIAEPFEYEIGKKGSGLTIHVPAGTPTDLGTIPRFLWWLLPPHDPRAAPAFALHDKLCQDAEFSRFIADAVFREALRVRNVPAWRAGLMFYGVRLWALVWRPSAICSVPPLRCERVPPGRQ